MEKKQLDELRANPQNPRQMSREDSKALALSLQKFGDLSGIVFNVQTNQLVGGHMRTGTMRQLPGDKEIIVTERYEQPNAVGTVAIGYVIMGGEKYGYREVDWSPENEAAANIAANRIQGDWNTQLLDEANYMLSESAPDLLALTGQNEKEIEKSLARVSGTGDEGQDEDQSIDEKMVFNLTPDQSAIVHEAINLCQKLNSLNPDDHGTALFYMAKLYLEGHKEDVPVEQPSERLDDV